MFKRFGGDKRKGGGGNPEFPVDVGTGVKKQKEGIRKGRIGDLGGEGGGGYGKNRMAIQDALATWGAKSMKKKGNTWGRMERRVP